MAQQLLFEKPSRIDINLKNTENIPPPPFEPESPPPLAFASTPKSPIVLNGIHISTHCETEERLTVQVENLEPEPFQNLGFAVEDWMKRVDDEYKIKRVRGRGWKGRGAKYATGELEGDVSADKLDLQSRKRVIRFSPFPSVYSNTLKAVRADLYYALRRHCFVLEADVKTPQGKRVGYRQNFYILPYANAPSMMNEINQLNKTIDDLNVQINAFLNTPVFNEVVEILAHYYRREALEQRYFVLGHITADFTPLAFDPKTVKDAVNQEYHRVFAEIDQMSDEKKQQLEEEFRRGEQSLYDELERKRVEMVTGTLNHLKQELETVAKQIVGQRRKDPASIKRGLELIRSKAISIGLEALADSVIRPLTMVVDNPEKAVELFGSDVKDLPAMVNSRVQGLMETL